jgi:hypothetical protein
LILYLSGPCVLPASCVFITSTSIWRAVKTPCVCLECGLYLSVSESVHYLWVSETYLSLSGMFVSVSASLWLCQRPSSSWYVSFISVCLSGTGPPSGVSSSLPIPGLGPLLCLLVRVAV